MAVTVALAIGIGAIPQGRTWDLEGLQEDLAAMRAAVRDAEARESRERGASETEQAVLAAYRGVQSDIDALRVALVAHHLEDLAREAQPLPPPYDTWDTEVPGGLPATAREDKAGGMGWGEETWWPGRIDPSPLRGDAPELSGVWYGAIGPTPWGDYGTLWHVRAYNAYGTIDGLEVWGIGDWVKGREGHVLYLSCVPHLDTTIQNCRFRRCGAQAIQREWRTTETDIPRDAWGAAGGTFTVEDCDFRETGMISTGLAARASWAMSLYSTGQHTIVRRVTHVNYHSPAPSEGSLFVGYGQSGFRTPTLLVEDCDFWCRSGDRAIIFLQAVDDAVIRNTRLRGDKAYIDVVDDCGTFALEDYPDGVPTQVRIKRADQPHNAPREVRWCPDGETLALSFQ
jgi:hypothetical protein